jgi:hypothetical protein
MARPLLFLFGDEDDAPAGRTKTSVVDQSERSNTSEYGQEPRRNIMIRAAEFFKRSAPLVLMFALLSVFATGCRVQQTEEGEMPDVDVQAEGGKLPEYDVDAADVDVKTEERTVKVPDVDVTMPEEKDNEKEKDDNRPPQ